MNRAVPVQASNASRATKHSAALGPKCGCGQPSSVLTGECSDCGRRRMLGAQAKLKVSDPGDRYEREADQVADRIARGGRFARRSRGYPTVLQAGASPGILVPEGVLDAALASPGQPLDASTRAFFERRLAHDFSTVRVHTGPADAAIADTLNARAFTLGPHVFFAGGQFRPHASHGRRLLAHELAHVVQQSGSRQPVTTDRSTRALAIQRQSFLESVRSGAGSLVPEAVWSAFSIDPAEIAAMAPNPGDAIALLKRLRDTPVLGPALFRALPTSDGVEKLLSLDPGTLDRIFAILADPEPHLESVRKQLQPLAEKVPAYAMVEADARLGWLKERGAGFALVMDAIGGQLAQLPGQWWPIAIDMFRSQFMLWDWSAEATALKELAAKREAGEFDDDYEYWLHAAKVLADGLDRILGAVGMAAFVAGLAGGGALGGAAGGTGAGVAGGAVTLGAGAAPSAAVGGTAGSAAGGGVGGGLGATVYELLGGVSLVAAITTEVALLGDAVKDLSLEVQGAERERADYEQIASSLIGLAMMAAFAVLGSIGARIANKTKSALLAAAKRSRRAAAPLAPAAAPVPAAAAPTPSLPTAQGAGPAPIGERARAGAAAPAQDAAPSSAAVREPAIPDRTAQTTAKSVSPQRVEDAARASTADLDASVADSSHLPNERISREQVANELAYVDRYPELVTGTAPNRQAKLGDHEIAEVPGGGCRRRSDPPQLQLGACPVAMQGPDQPAEATSVVGRSRLARKVALGLLEHRDVLQQAELIGTARSAGKVPDVSGALLGAVRHERTRANVPPAGESQGSRVAGVRVSEKRGEGGDAARRGNAIVKVLGRGGVSYHDIVRAIAAPDVRINRASEERWMRYMRSVQDAGNREAFGAGIAAAERALWLPDQDLAGAMREIVTTGALPQRIAQRREWATIGRQLVRATYLLFVRESVRDPSNVVHAMMMLDLVETGRLSFVHALDLRSRFKWEGGKEFAGRASQRRWVGELGAERAYERVYPLPLPKKSNEKASTLLPLPAERLEGEKAKGRVITERGHGGFLPSSMLKATETASRLDELLTPPADRTQRGRRPAAETPTQAERDVLDYLLRQDMLTVNWLEHVARLERMDDPAAVETAIEAGLRALYGLPGPAAR